MTAVRFRSPIDCEADSRDVVPILRLHAERYNVREEQTMSGVIPREMAKYWWLECVGCAEASLTTQMRGFGLENPPYEQGLHS
jgi:hypothetical protein